MPLAPGTRLGHFEIVAAAGAGGMGEVYRARDTRLDRTVAIKVLPAALSQRPESRQRFEREARAVSALSHPNICALYDIGRQETPEGPIDYLVMEYLEGETLASRLQRGPLPIEELFRVAIPIGEALSRAHREGVVHRDLKPGNVMLTKTGAKLLDFGLAKSAALDAALSDLTVSPTRTSPLTAEGTIVGTFQYMAPEQLEGKPADARSDIFAFGSLLYEMATARRAFEGKTQASLIAAILERQPPAIDSVVPMLPPALDRLVRTCVAKDPDERRQSMQDVVLDLRWMATAGSQAGVPAPVAARRRGRERLAWSLAALLAAVTALLAYGFAARAPVSPSLVRSYVLPAVKSTFHFGGGGGPPEIAPDGSALVFAANTAEGKPMLWIRQLDESDPRPIAGTEGAIYPFWSPDSRSVGFFGGRKLRRVDVAGGPIQVICDAQDGRGGSWGPDGTILFAPTWREPLSRVSAAGGIPEPVTSLDPAHMETTHRWPFFLPDGRHFIFLSASHTWGQASKTNGLYLSELGSKDRRLLVVTNANGAYSQGHLLFMRDNTLMTQRFDEKRLSLEGEAVPVVDGVTTAAGYFRAVFTVSGNGILAYQAGGASGGLTRLVLADRSGHELQTLGKEGNFIHPRISPDGRQVATEIEVPPDLWVYEIGRQVLTRLTFDPAADEYPLWTPDGKAIVFRSYRTGLGEIYSKTASGTGQEERLFPSGEMGIPNSWSGDGQSLLYQSLSVKTGWDLWVYTRRDRKTTPFLQTEFAEMNGRFSPDARYIAYRSDESGRDEVYVQPYPPTGGKWQVSVSGGDEPVWRGDGREIVYRADDGMLTAVPVDTKGPSGCSIGAPQVLFEPHLKDAPGAQFDMLPDGQRFLLNVPVQIETSQPIILLQNWTASLKR